MSKDQKMNEVSLEQLKDKVRGKLYNANSSDSNSLHISFSGACLEINMDSGIDGEIVIFKPETLCEVSIDSDDIIEAIYSNEDASEIKIEFSNELSDLEIIEV